MDRTELPEPFAALADLAGDPTIDRAVLLGKALKAVPDLQRWLREERQLTVRALLDGPYDRNDLAPHLEVTPQRVADIAAGHRNAASLAKARKNG
ncbi:sigma-70 family RNA polymerase sigma factor [Streptomyces sp. NBC_00425]|uniref:sigma-70 family RNA polymerase sigma factor n=1 Tax=Streptomyces sp. NBC_00425 TaxID=2975740 RepID=UPI002E23B7B1